MSSDFKLLSTEYILFAEYRAKFRRIIFVKKSERPAPEGLIWKDPRKYKLMHRKCLEELLLKTRIIRSETDELDSRENFLRQTLTERVSSSYFDTAFSEELQQLILDNANNENNSNNHDNNDGVVDDESNDNEVEGEEEEEDDEGDDDCETNTFLREQSNSPEYDYFPGNCYGNPEIIVNKSPPSSPSHTLEEVNDALGDEDVNTIKQSEQAESPSKNLPEIDESTERKSEQVEGVIRDSTSLEAYSSPQDTEVAEASSLFEEPIVNDNNNSKNNNNNDDENIEITLADSEDPITMAKQKEKTGINKVSSKDKSSKRISLSDYKERKSDNNKSPSENTKKRRDSSPLENSQLKKLRESRSSSQDKLVEKKKKKRKLNSAESEEKLRINKVIDNVLAKKSIEKKSIDDSPSEKNTPTRIGISKNPRISRVGNKNSPTYISKLSPESSIDKTLARTIETTRNSKSVKKAKEITPIQRMRQLYRHPSLTEPEPDNTDNNDDNDDVVHDGDIVPAINQKIQINRSKDPEEESRRQSCDSGISLRDINGDKCHGDDLSLDNQDNLDTTSDLLPSTDYLSNRRRKIQRELAEIERKTDEAATKPVYPKKKSLPVDDTAAAASAAVQKSRNDLPSIHKNIDVSLDILPRNDSNKTSEELDKSSVGDKNDSILSRDPRRKSVNYQSVIENTNHEKELRTFSTDDEVSIDISPSILPSLDPDLIDECRWPINTGEVDLPVVVSETETTFSKTLTLGFDNNLNIQVEIPKPNILETSIRINPEAMNAINDATRNPELLTTAVNAMTANPVDHINDNNNKTEKCNSRVKLKKDNKKSKVNNNDRRKHGKIKVRSYSDMAARPEDIKLSPVPKLHDELSLEIPDSFIEMCKNNFTYEEILSGLAHILQPLLFNIEYESDNPKPLTREGYLGRQVQLVVDYLELGLTKKNRNLASLVSSLVDVFKKENLPYQLNENQIFGVFKDVGHTTCYILPNSGGSSADFSPDKSAQKNPANNIMTTQTIPSNNFDANYGFYQQKNQNLYNPGHLGCPGPGCPPRMVPPQPAPTGQQGFHQPGVDLLSSKEPARRPAPPPPPSRDPRPAKKSKSNDFPDIVRQKVSEQQKQQQYLQQQQQTYSQISQQQQQQHSFTQIPQQQQQQSFSQVPQQTSQQIQQRLPVITSMTYQQIQSSISNSNSSIPVYPTPARNPGPNSYYPSQEPYRYFTPQGHQVLSGVNYPMMDSNELMMYQANYPGVYSTDNSVYGYPVGQAYSNVPGQQAAANQGSSQGPLLPTSLDYFSQPARQQQQQQQQQQQILSIPKKPKPQKPMAQMQPQKSYPVQQMRTPLPNLAQNPQINSAMTQQQQQQQQRIRQTLPINPTAQTYQNVPSLPYSMQSSTVPVESQSISRNSGQTVRQINQQIAQNNPDRTRVYQDGMQQRYEQEKRFPMTQPSICQEACCKPPRQMSASQQSIPQNQVQNNLQQSAPGNSYNYQNPGQQVSPQRVVSTISQSVNPYSPKLAGLLLQSSDDAKKIAQASPYAKQQNRQIPMEPQAPRIDQQLGLQAPQTLSTEQQRRIESSLQTLRATQNSLAQMERMINVQGQSPPGRNPQLNPSQTSSGKSSKLIPNQTSPRVSGVNIQLAANNVMQGTSGSGQTARFINSNQAFNYPTQVEGSSVISTDQTTAVVQQVKPTEPTRVVSMEHNASSPVNVLPAPVSWHQTIVPEVEENSSVSTSLPQQLETPVGSTAEQTTARENTRVISSPVKSKTPEKEKTDSANKNIENSGGVDKPSKLQGMKLTDALKELEQYPEMNPRNKSNGRKASPTIIEKKQETEKTKKKKENKQKEYSTLAIQTDSCLPKNHPFSRDSVKTHSPLDKSSSQNAAASVDKSLEIPTGILATSTPTENSIDKIPVVAFSRLENSDSQADESTQDQPIDLSLSSSSSERDERPSSKRLRLPSSRRPAISRNSQVEIEVIELDDSPIDFTCDDYDQPENQQIKTENGVAENQVDNSEKTAANGKDKNSEPRQDEEAAAMRKLKEAWQQEEQRDDNNSIDDDIEIVHEELQTAGNLSMDTKPDIANISQQNTEKIDGSAAPDADEHAATDGDVPLFEAKQEPIDVTKLCDWCGKVQVKIMCGECRQKSYCSEECQITDWHDKHNSECHTTFEAPLLAESPGSPPLVELD